MPSKRPLSRRQFAQAAAALTALATGRRATAMSASVRSRSFTLRASKLFGIGSGELTPDGDKLLRTIAARLRSSAVSSLTINVYSDTHGVPAHNRRLTQRRADSVRKVVAQALPTVRIRAIGMGEADAVASNETADGRWRNRRVEIRFDLPRER